MSLTMAMRGAPPMIGPAAIGATSSASLLVDSVALAAATAFSNHARAAVSGVQSTVYRTVVSVGTCFATGSSFPAV